MAHKLIFNHDPARGAQVEEATMNVLVGSRNPVKIAAIPFLNEALYFINGNSEPSGIGTKPGVGIRGNETPS
jgi:hypothetical protein